jgi:TfoX/Sxy family transcriptional regulator of competence genes
MPVSSSFRTFIVEQLSRVVPRVRARSMFGGVGIYSGRGGVAAAPSKRSNPPARVD